MSEILKFAIFGAASGAIYGLLALGVNVAYRASRVVNFAHAAVAICAAYFYNELQAALPTYVAIPLAVIGGGLVGLLIELITMRALRNASVLTRAIATIGVLLIIQSILNLRYGHLAQVVPAWLPSGSIGEGDFTIGADRVIVFFICLALTVGLYLLYRLTSFGRATSALAENPRSLAALGRWSPQLVSAINWTLAGMLAGLAGVLLAPISSLSPTLCVALIVPVLSAALLGKMSSLWLAFVGAIGIGMAQGVIGRFSTVPGIQDAIPFIVIVIILVFRGRSLPARGELAERLPSVSLGVVPRLPLLVATVITGALVLWILPERWVSAVSAGLISAIILMSLVVVTGYAGQLSLASYALAGVAALVSGQLVANAGWSFLPAALVGVLATLPVGLIVGLPAVRTRGINLAIVTLGLAVVFQTVVLDNRLITNGVAGLDVSNPEIFGIPISAIEEPRRYAVIVLIAALLTGLAVLNVRRSTWGRRMVAVRANERASAALGINVASTKLTAFLISAVIAGTGGVLLAFTNFFIVLGNPGGRFDPFFSLNAIAEITVGGVGYVSGALLGTITEPSSVVGLLLLKVAPGAIFGLVGGILLIVTVIASPSGAVASAIPVLRKIPGLRGKPQQIAVPPESIKRPAIEPAFLEVSGFTVRFGSVDVVKSVDLRLTAGRVMGVIGPNGAGKTTLVDAITGFASPSSGTISLDGEDLSKASITARARRGIARSFQSLELFEDLTVADNLVIAAERPPKWRIFLAALFPGKPQLSPAAAAAIRTFDLTDRLNDLPRDLSYGERRLLAIARALAGNPRVLLLDEPAAGLGMQERQELRTLIRRIADDWNVAVLLIEHDVDLVMSVSDDMVALDFGAIIATGTPSDVRRDPAVIASYLGGIEEEHEMESTNG
ncbi:branched-chain amino acid ABC transporter permease/ATP-binding protein [Arthrobacter sp. YN]|uniref:branched-chain amino acid ABC transporter permease/ATP-binding protein n=1 Tax=Arthrobacter sp. YN TaxID=2020486 RepID=UPI000B5E058C|nr:branched-chain amino acid ABC transporter permease/ATP-binding protein [Arthrobacter sp. YN]ASN20140.1 hypothetical protein CGK93_11025 [Arthrobacter sp. YN]